MYLSKKKKIVFSEITGPHITLVGAKLFFYDLRYRSYCGNDPLRDFSMSVV